MRICHPSQLNARVQTARPPRISTTTFIPSTRHIYVPRPVQYRTSLCLASSSSVCRLVCDFCSSGREFASSFFQIPPRGGHPCSSLTVPTAKSVVDFHHQVVVHAAHTTKKPSANWRTAMMEPAKGFEPLTCALRMRCSSTELCWRLHCENTIKIHRFSAFANNLINFSCFSSFCALLPLFASLAIGRILKDCA